MVTFAIFLRCIVDTLEPSMNHFSEYFTSAWRGGGRGSALGPQCATVAQRAELRSACGVCGKTSGNSKPYRPPDTKELSLPASWPYCRGRHSYCGR